MIICVQGLGYVGSAMCVAIAMAKKNFKNKNFKVIGVDLPTVQGKKIINKINNGIFPFRSNDGRLKLEIKKCTKSGILNATESTEVFKKANIIIVSINCDLKKRNGKLEVDLEKFKKSIAEVIEKVGENTLIIVQSTVPPGTCKKLIKLIVKNIFLKRKLNPKKIYIAHSYERVTPGKNYLDSIINNNMVYSGINKESADKCENFLKRIINVKKYPLSRLQDTNSSELGKLMENSYRAVNIAFIDEWNRLGDKLNVNLFDIINTIKKRPTHNNLKDPGLGVGGYCLTKDPLMAKLGAKQIWGINQKFDFSSMAVEVNKSMPFFVIEKIKNYFNNKLKNIKILLLGITYKEDIEDTRNSPSELFFKKMLSMKAKVSVHDPLVDFWKEQNIKVIKSIPDISKFNLVVFAVKHINYKKINFKNWKNKNKNFLILDANNVLSNKQRKIIKKKNFNLISIGRNT